MSINHDQMAKAAGARIMNNHPCLSEAAHGKFARLHLPVAPACNIQCNYCIRRFDCVNETRPGVTSVVLTPLQAIERVRAVMERNSRVNVIGIAGPGDPLANDAAFETMRLVRAEFPEIILCISTNGFLLPGRLQEILACGVESVTVTINALTAGTARRIYSTVSSGGETLRGGAAAEALLQNQWEGLSNAVRAGLAVKVNSILIPGINDGEVPGIALRAGREGAHIMNVMPLIPQAAFRDLKRPSCGMLAEMRGKCGAYMPQMTHCKQCRADAFGLLGEDRDIEMELLNSMIGQDYCDNV
ncbi:MAG: radical SAM protein [Nitrospiraceae bacterium]|nr:radical SAM protein [Nitrospiraceae bacterium]